jgi:hypothetical protein
LSRPYEHASVRLLALKCAMVIVLAIRTRSETFFALLQLLEQAEVSRYFGTHFRDGGLERLCSMTRER